MKEIPITKGYTAIIDNEDFDRVKDFKWHYHGKGYGLHATISDRKLRRPPGRKLLAYRIDREPLPPGRLAWRPLPVNPRSNFLQAPTHNRR